MKKFKTLLFLLGLLFLMTTSVLAKPIITSDTNYFDINTGQYVLKGNVYIETGSRIITAGQAKVDMTSLEVWAQDGVTVRQDNLTFHGQNVYVAGADKTATITGGVDLSRDGLLITADSVKYNWDNKIAEFTGNVNVNNNGNSYTSSYVSYDMLNNKIL
ncbi:MAG: lptD 4 [Firmicutes bacterium]|nr:lptD 4 [Bacillota bacterium]